MSWQLRDRPTEAAHELDRSIAVIETHLGVTPEHFANRWRYRGATR